jgi:transmembrane sensor
MIHNIWILIGKKLSGEATAEELLELEQLLQQGAADQYPLEVLEDLWRMENQPPVDEPKLSSKWDAFEAKLDAAELQATEDAPSAESTEPVKSKTGVVKYLKIISLVMAACFAVVFVLINKKGAANNNKTNQITAPANGISKVQLAKLWQ